MAKLLLVEDDNNLREIYEARLSAEGYEITTAQNGEEALSLAKSVRPDLIISDVMMPRISGFEMLDILRNTDELKHTKIIMLTALGQTEDRGRADNLGADKYLVKSQVTLEDIVKAAEEILSDDGSTLTTATVTEEASAADSSDTLPAQAPAAPAETSESTPPAPQESTPVTEAIPTPEPAPTAETAATPEPVEATPQAESAEPVAQSPAESIPETIINPAPTPPTTPIGDPATAEPSTPNDEDVAPIVTVTDPDPILTPQSIESTPPAPQESTPVTEAIPTPEPAPTAETAATPEPVEATPQAESAEPVAQSPAESIPETIINPAPTPPTTLPESIAQTEQIADSEAVVKTEAESLADEEAAMLAQINAFAESPAPTPQEVTPEPAQSTNDSILTEAINQLTEIDGLPAPSGQVIAPGQSTTPETTGNGTTITPTEILPEPQAEEEHLAATDAPEPISQQVTGKKVIQPLSSAQAGEPNLEELLAKEDALSNGVSPASSAPITPNNNEQSSIDPNSIAL